MTKEEKIIALKKLLKLNFQYNFIRLIGGTHGLCALWQMYVFGDDTISDYDISLRFAIPELVPELKDPELIYYYWWPDRGLFKPWWERHKAIRKTIKHLKNHD